MKLLFALAIAGSASASAAPLPSLEVPTSPALTQPPGPAWDEPAERPKTSIGRDVVAPGAALDARLPELPGDYRVDVRGAVRIAYHPSQRDAALRVLTQADAAREQLSAVVGQRVLERVEIRLARTPDELAALAPRAAPPPSGSDAVAYPGARLVALSVQPSEDPSGDPSGDGTPLEARARHALAHVALHDAVDGQPLPRWLDEGFAVDAGTRTYGGKLAHATTLMRAQIDGTTLPLAQLESFPDDPSTVALAEAEAGDLVHSLSREADRARFTALLGRLRTGEPFARALSITYGADLPTIEARWHEELSRRYLAFPAIGVGVTVWGALTLAAIVAWRRRRRAALLEGAPRLAPETIAQLAPDARPSRPPKLIVVDEGRGHVVYMVSARAVPKIVHEGKEHTVH